jgi:hypothetical protein
MPAMNFLLHSSPLPQIRGKGQGEGDIFKAFFTQPFGLVAILFSRVL